MAAVLPVHRRDSDTSIVHADDPLTGLGVCKREGEQASRPRL